MSAAEPATDRVATAAVVALALVAYVGVALPFQAGLMVEAALILAIVVALPGRRWTAVGTSLRAAPLAVLWGLGLWTGAAVWGAAVGLLAGNPLRYVAGQATAMLLLPLAAVAFLTRRTALAMPLARGLAVAALVALVLHVLDKIVMPAPVGPDGNAARLALRWTIGFGGRDVMCVLLALASLPVLRSPLIVAGGSAAMILLVGGMSRGGWVAAAAGGAVVVLLQAGLTSRRGRALLLAACAASALGLVLLLWLGGAGSVIGKLTAATPGVTAVSPDEAAAGGRDQAPVAVVFSRELRHVDVQAPLPRPGMPLALSVRLRGEPGERCEVVLQASDAGGREVRTFQATMVGSGRWDTRRRVVQCPPGAASVRISMQAQHGRWLVAELSVAALPSWPAAFARQLRNRVASLSGVLVSPAGDPTVRYRLDEWGAVSRAWSQAGPLRLLAGHGLGAQIEFTNPGWAADGRHKALPEASYLHNLYVFLGFKLGLGGLAALAGLAAVIGWTAARAGALRRDPARGWILTAALACWVAFLLWDVSSPQLIDFRLAPLFGAFIAAAVSGAVAPTGE